MSREFPPMNVANDGVPSAFGVSTLRKLANDVTEPVNVLLPLMVTLSWGPLTISNDVCAVSEMSAAKSTDPASTLTLVVPPEKTSWVPGTNWIAGRESLNLPMPVVTMDAFGVAKLMFRSMKYTESPNALIVEYAYWELVPVSVRGLP